MEAVFGREWVKGTLEELISSDLCLWNISFDDGITQTMSLTVDTVGTEWRLEGDDTVAAKVVSEDPNMKARQELPDILAMGIMVEAKYRRSARFFQVQFSHLRHTWEAEISHTMKQYAICHSRIF